MALSGSEGVLGRRLAGVLLEGFGEEMKVSVKRFRRAAVALVLVFGQLTLCGRSVAAQVSRTMQTESRAGQKENSAAETESDAAQTESPKARAESEAGHAELARVVPRVGAGGGEQAKDESPLARYFDARAGVSVEEAVADALEHNGELLAVRAEIEAGRALVRQAGARANPSLEVRGSKQLGGMGNGVMAEASLPLELGGRRAARVLVAQRELEMRELMLADRERMLAADVRAKFGEALAEILKLGFAEELLTVSRRGYRLTVARVVEGRTAPLEQNMVLVEVNRLRSMREAAEGRVEVALLELRNMMGRGPEEQLRLRGDFLNLIEPLPPLEETTRRALAERPDILAARAAERLAEAQIEEARAMGRADASLTAGYERMRSGFDLRGVGEAGALMPIEGTFHSVTFGVTVELPVRNKNIGAIEAAAAAASAAQRRREFAELTVRREVAAAHARYERAARAMEIFRAGVNEQANQNLDVIKRTYELGAKTLLDYIAEQRRYIELESDYINSILETYLARVEVARASMSAELMRRDAETTPQPAKR